LNIGRSHPRVPAYQREASGRRARLALLIAFLVLLLAIGLFAVRLWTVVHAVSPRTQPQDVLALVQPPPEEPGSLAWKIKHDERINILLFGYGGPGHDGPYLTDSMLLVSIRGASKEAVVITLPRDLWVKVPALPNGRFMMTKFNEAFAIGIDRKNFPNVRDDWKTPTGGGDLAAATAADVTGLRIDYWVGVDFKAFEDLVNALDGIDITVPEVLDDPFFPLGETTGYMRIHFNAGPQRMNGERALQYARSRETTSDFDRSRRQQLMLIAIRRRVLSVNAIPRMFSVLAALQDNVRTNLRIPEMRQLAELADQFKETDIRRLSIDNTNLVRDTVSPEGLYILVPRDPTYETLHRTLAMALPDPAPLQDRIPIRVQDGTLRYALWPHPPAHVVADILQSVGWNASEGPSLTARQLAVTEIRDATGGTAPATLSWLQAFLGGRVIEEPVAESGPAITVVLGSDFTGKAFPPGPPPAPPPSAASTPTPAPPPGLIRPVLPTSSPPDRRRAAATM